MPGMDWLVIAGAGRGALGLAAGAAGSGEDGAWAVTVFGAAWFGDGFFAGIGMSMPGMFAGCPAAGAASATSASALTVGVRRYFTKWISAETERRPQAAPRRSLTRRAGRAAGRRAHDSHARPSPCPRSSTSPFWLRAAPASGPSPRAGRLAEPAAQRQSPPQSTSSYQF